MKKVYLYLLIGAAALIFLVVSLAGFNPAVEKWSSLFAGFTMGLFIVLLPSIIAHFKKSSKA